MIRTIERWFLLVAFLLLSAGLMYSCQGDLERDMYPESEWRDMWRELLEARGIEDGDENVSIDDALYFYLGEPIDINTANWSTVQLFTADQSIVPGGIEFFDYEGPNDEPYGIIFRAMCHLFPDTDYQLFIIGVKTSSGAAIPDTVINFRTGGVPGDLESPFYCDTFALAWDLEDTNGINGGILELIRMDVYASGVKLFPPPETYLMMNDPDYIFGYGRCCPPPDYTKRDAKALRSPPYSLLIYILNTNFASALDLSVITLADRYVNLRPYLLREVIDHLDGDNNWISDDPTNTPASFDTSDKRLDKNGCLKVGLSGVLSVGDEVSRTWTGGQFAPLASQSGIQFAVMVGNVGAGSNLTLALQLTDADGDVVETTRALTNADTSWLLVTRRIDDFTVVVFNDGFDKTSVTKTAFSINANDIVGDLFLDFLSAGILEEFKVYIPDEFIPKPNFVSFFSPALPLYVGGDGSTYFARDDGVHPHIHIVDLFLDSCSLECPLMGPHEAMTDEHLARQAP